MHCIKRIKAPLSLLVLAVVTRPCFGGRVFNFDYNLPGDSLGYFATITASGNLTTTDDLDGSSGGYLITGIQGTRTMNGVEARITSLLPPGYYYNSNMLYYPGGPFLDYGGIFFTIDKPLYGDDLYGDVVLYYDPNVGLYRELADWTNPGTFNVSPAAGGPSTPEPSTMVLLGFALAALAVCGGRRTLRR